MKVVETVARNEEDYREAVNGKRVMKLGLSFRDGEPEDATISRDFSGVHDIVTLMRDDEVKWYEF